MMKYGKPQSTWCKRLIEDCTLVVVRGMLIGGKKVYTGKRFSQPYTMTMSPVSDVVGSGILGYPCSKSDDMMFGSYNSI